MLWGDPCIYLPYGKISPSWRKVRPFRWLPLPPPSRLCESKFARVQLERRGSVEHSGSPDWKPWGLPCMTSYRGAGKHVAVYVCFIPCRSQVLGMCFPKRNWINFCDVTLFKYNWRRLLRDNSWCISGLSPPSYFQSNLFPYAPGNIIPAPKGKVNDFAAFSGL